MKKFIQNFRKRSAVSPVKSIDSTPKKQQTVPQISTADRMLSAAQRVDSRGNSSFSSRKVDETVIVKRRSSYNSYHQGLNHVQVEATSTRVATDAFELGTTDSHQEVVVSLN